MYVVYERFYKDGKKYWRHQSEDKFDCEVWIELNEYAIRSILAGKAELIIEDVK